MALSHLKAALRPAYRKYIQGINQETNSTLTIKDFGQATYAYRGGSTDELILSNVQGYALSEIAPGFSLRPKSTVINIGAHVGAFVVPIAQLASRVYGIEAASDTYNFLRLNKALNRRDNLSIHHLAITDHDGPCTLYFDTGHWGHSITKQLSKKTETVRGVTLSTFFRENQIEECDLLYFNCEGAEFPILLNTPNEVLQRVRVISADCHTDLWKLNTIEDLCERLKRSGFRHELIENEGTYKRLLAQR